MTDIFEKRGTFEKIAGTGVEIAAAPPRGSVRHAVFDFDGTLSTLRDGWQDFMVPMMVEVLEECPRREPREALEALVIDFVDHLTGKQTIYQMIRLAEEVARRGGTPKEPLEYKCEYYRRLAARVEERIAELKSGRKHADDFLIPGARSFLEELARRGVRSYLASGTDIEYVREEARLLGLEGCFGGGIHGALAAYKEFSKEKVIKAILAEQNLRGPELLVVGDGYVEIVNGREVGAITWGLYTEERNQYHMNDDKRARLIRAGAHLLAPDLADGKAVLDYLGT